MRPPDAQADSGQPAAQPPEVRPNGRVLAQTSDARRSPFPPLRYRQTAERRHTKPWAWCPCTMPHAAPSPQRGGEQSRPTPRNTHTDPRVDLDTASHPQTHAYAKRTPTQTVVTHGVHMAGAILLFRRLYTPGFIITPLTKLQRVHSSHSSAANRSNARPRLAAKRTHHTCDCSGRRLQAPPLHHALPNCH